jgi:predicted porin
MWANGSNGNGLAGVSLPEADDKTDYRLQTLSLGMEYEFKKDISVRGAYIYDRYDDDAYESASGSRNTLWLGINYRL